MYTSTKYFKQFILLFISLLAFQTSNAQHIVSGFISSDGGDPLENVLVAIDGSIEEQVFSRNNGYYEFTVPENGHFVITPCANSNVLNGVTTLDRVIISRHLEGVQAIDSPYKIIAADVDQDDAITGLDTVVIYELILGQLPNFPNNKSWRFIEEAYVFPDPTNPFLEDYPEEVIIDNLVNDTTINFIGVKLGDINNSAVSTLGNTAINCDGSPISNTSDFETIDGLNIFPNPFTEEINLDLGKEFKNISIEVYSSTGILRNNYKFKNTNNISLNLENNASGVYFIKVAAEDKIGWESVIKK